MVWFGYVFQNYVEEVSDIEVEKIEISSDKTTINKGEIIELNTKVIPEDATNKSITFSSSNPKVLTVSLSGKVTGISSGKATITAKANNGVTSEIEITVYSSVTNILLSTNTVRVQKDGNFKINAEVLPEDADNKNIEYKKLLEEVDNIMESYPNLQQILEDDKEINLTKTDCRMLQKLFNLQLDISQFEEQEIFFLGGKEAYFYFKNIGILKE